MTFDVTADAYDRFMGRFAAPLAEQFVRFAQVRAGQRALDVGCGPGALTARLVAVLGAGAVVAVDPSAPFVDAARRRFPGVDMHAGVAEQLHLPDHSVDVALAQLVVPFMTDPVSGLREMARVARRGGVVAACAWDHAGGSGPLAAFWGAARDTDPDAPGEADMAGTREGHLAELFGAAGLGHVEPATLSVVVRFSSFAEWWEPFTFGVGPAGAYVRGLDEARLGLVRARCEQLMPAAPFSIDASAWAVRAVVEGE